MQATCDRLYGQPIICFGKEVFVRLIPLREGPAFAVYDGLELVDAIAVYEGPGRYVACSEGFRLASSSARRRVHGSRRIVIRRPKTAA